MEIKSPLNLNGTVSPGWMFEGSFPVKILDDKRNLIATGIAQEVTPGGWMSGENVEFISDIAFSTKASSGFIVLEKDNPSGLPENAVNYEFPIKFNFNLEYTCPASGWVNCMPVLDEVSQKACSKEAIQWYTKNCPNFEGVAQ